MPTAVPALEAVLTAIQTEIDAVNFATGSVIVTDLKFESELEGIEAYKQAGDGSIDLWRVTGTPDEIEGDAPGEAYSIYDILCEYWNVREGDANWEKGGRQQVEAIRERLNGNANVFRPSGQTSVFGTPETATVEDQGLEFVEDQLVFKARIRLRVEARRWS